MKENVAYKIMFQFLENRYFRLKTDALGELLGELQLDEDGLPFDPAIVKDWELAIEQAKADSNQSRD